MAQACLHWGGKVTSQGLQSISELLLPSDCLLTHPGGASGGERVALLCILQLRGKGLCNRARARQQTVLTQWAKAAVWENKTPFSQLGTGQLD